MTEICSCCDSESSQFVTNKLRHGKIGNVVKCNQCGLVRIDNALSYEEKLNQYYQEQYSEEYYLGIKKDLDMLYDSFLAVQSHRVEKIKNYIKKDHSLLEVGSGPGYFLHAIRPHLKEIQGIELNRKEAQYANESKHIPTSEQPIENTDVKTSYFDHICIFQVLEHAANPVKFLQKLKKFSKSGSYIHIEVPNVNDPLVAFYNVESYRDFYYQEPHLYYFTPETLKSVCEKAGFEIINIYGFQQTSIINNLNWVFLEKPQASRFDCIQAILPSDKIRKDIPAHKLAEFDKFLNQVNDQYRDMMEKLNYSDMIFATIRIK